jgi:hypothetical protein
LFVNKQPETFLETQHFCEALLIVILLDCEFQIQDLKMLRFNNNERVSGNQSDHRILKILNYLTAGNSLVFCKFSQRYSRRGNRCDVTLPRFVSVKVGSYWAKWRYAGAWYSQSDLILLLPVNRRL